MQLDPRLKPWHHPASTDSKPLLLRQALCLTRHTFWSASRLASPSWDSSFVSSIKIQSKDFAGRPEFCLPCFGSHNMALLVGSSGWRWQYTISHTQSSFTFSDNFEIGPFSFWTLHINIALFSRTIVGTYGRPSWLEIYQVYPGDEYKICLGGRGTVWAVAPRPTLAVQLEPRWLPLRQVLVLDNLREKYGNANNPYSFTLVICSSQPWLCRTDKRYWKLHVRLLTFWLVFSVRKLLMTLKEDDSGKWKILKGFV